MKNQDPAIGIIGGSGLYEIDGLSDVTEETVETPFGSPSDTILMGYLDGRRVCFLARHGRGHRLLPHEINHRANIFALRRLNVRWLISVSAVGSLQERYQPRHLVLPDQFFDRTSVRDNHTFFGGGIAAHISLAQPTSAPLRKILFETASELDCTAHDGGTYLAMDGPAFSTLAESKFYRSQGYDIIGMTNMGEVKLAREAEMAQATVAMITDYDCWHQVEAPVTVETVISHLQANAALARQLIRQTIPRLPLTPDWPEHRALDSAIVTERSLWPAETVRRLSPILERFQ